MMRRENGRVLIDISTDDFNSLLLCLGYATGAARDKATRNAWLRLANAVNEGNPDWTPYDVPEQSA